MAKTFGSLGSLANEKLTLWLRGSSAGPPDREQDPAPATIVAIRLTSGESPSPEAA